ncbi:LysR family transcriptional regulator [Streptomyces lavendulae subsp. lavendulae]|uniref:LysR family transcriptional regulator n=1 Tax=Streptomyces lavendulae TaxID=1914 RepID=UPI0024A42745|nr:LysR family transcriptional regulator [Streptomyces lavendulae]GLV87453.1 LysR family transcriptional regulator [Streptomyces lavendulae subsp. lavendulae]
MERHEIEAFLTLAEELHFRRTSERLGLAQGRVSQTIKKLERRIGVPLFERTSRRVALTAIGEQLRDDLLPAHRQIQRAVARATETGRGIGGTLRVGYSGPMIAETILKAAERFRARYPGSDVQIQEVQLCDPFGPIRSGRVHVQITERPVTEPDLTVGPLVLAAPRALMVPDHHPLARRASVSLEDLAGASLVTITGSVAPYWLDHHYPRSTPAGRTIPRGPTAMYWPELLTLVAAGGGVSPACATVERYYARPGITWVPFHDAPPVEFGFLWPASGETARVRAFVELCPTVA